ncbi:FadR/GntR family transcriptional regulator [Afifella pfennigii]|uniref:FadR/GntR family transcriptional regulator n=1 Tax=Afifella pfennigii TaxID=209897 RepID=UPI00068F46DA|nr:GntR family transcriptional regulator [Afifella pfennigii]
MKTDITPRRRSALRDKDHLAGVIQFRGILGEAVAELGQRIVGGEWQPGEALPREADLTESLGVSRSVIREAVRILGAKGLLRSRTSDGTRVTPRSEWRLLDPDVMDWRIRSGDTTSLLEELLRVRLVLEPGIVHAATQMADAAARSRIRAAWEAKVEVFTTPDPDYAERRRRFIETDLEFHRAFLAAVDSQLLLQLFSVIEAALGLLIDVQMRARGYETEMIGMEESHELHAAVFAEFERGDADAAGAAMRRLIERAIGDAREGLSEQQG